ncbi:MAG: hypothetical protein AAF125_26240, partial [Chloroflexota bacterium]
MRIRVTGATPLNGTFTPASNPNAAKALLAATMLSDKTATLRHVPRNTSTSHLFSAAASLGASLNWTEPQTLNITTEALTARTLDRDLVSGAVGALLFLPALIVRRHHVRVEVSFPLNRIRTHLDVIRDLGLDVMTMAGAVEFRSNRWASKDVIMDTPSVTATAIGLMLAATLGEHTIIRNAA